MFRERLGRGLRERGGGSEIGDEDKKQKIVGSGCCGGGGGGGVGVVKMISGENECSGGCEDMHKRYRSRETASGSHEL